MKALHINLTIFCILSIGLIFSACNKNENRPPVNFETLAEDAAVGDQVYSDMFRAVNNESGILQNQNGNGIEKADDCGIVTTTGYVNEWPTLLSIDFGSGCTDNHGVVRKGKLTVAYHGPYFAAGSSLTVVTENYYVNGYTVDGSLTITNNGRNTNGNYEFEVSVQNARILKPNGRLVTFESERSFEWSEGESSFGLGGWCDNAWLVKGHSEGMTSDGHDYRVEITTPLKKKSCCPWVVEGFVTIDVDDGSESATLDYGDGDCNRLAQYSYNGNTVQITIP